MFENKTCLSIAGAGSERNSKFLIKGQEWSTNQLSYFSDSIPPCIYVIYFLIFAQYFHFPILDLIPRITSINILYLCILYHFARPCPILCNKAFCINSTGSFFLESFCSTYCMLCYCRQLMLHILNCFSFFHSKFLPPPHFRFLQSYVWVGGRISFFPHLFACIQDGVGNANLMGPYSTTSFGLYFLEYVIIYWKVIRSGIVFCLLSLDSLQSRDWDKYIGIGILYESEFPEIRSEV